MSRPSCFHLWVKRWRLLRFLLVSVLLALHAHASCYAETPFWNVSVFSDDGITNMTVIEQRQQAVQYALQLWQQYYSGRRAQTVTCNFSFINETYPFYRDKATRETDLFYVTQSFVSTAANQRPFYPSGSYQLASDSSVQEFLFTPIESNALQCWVYLRTSKPFYLGTDGNPPPGEYDLPTVVLRASAIVLGFTGLIRANEANEPRFLIDKNNNEASTFFDLFLYGSPYVQQPGLLPIALLGAYVHHQDLLTRYVTSDELYFASATSVKAVPRMYAPSTYDPAESIYFLRPSDIDQQVLDRLWLDPVGVGGPQLPLRVIGSADALMYPTLPTGIAIHAIGNLIIEALLCANDGCEVEARTRWPVYGIVLFVLGTMVASIFIAVFLVFLLRRYARYLEKKRHLSEEEEEEALFDGSAEIEEELAFELGVDDLHREYTTISHGRLNRWSATGMSMGSRRQRIPPTGSFGATR